MSDSAKKSKDRGAKRAGKDHGSIITDPRFSSIQTDPRYRLPNKRQTHVKLDKRFAHMLRDKDFSRNAAVDRYGRKLARDDTKKQLERFYRLDEGEEDEEEDEKSDALSIDDDEDVRRELKEVEKRDYDPARDGGFSESSSSEESSSEEEDDEDEVEELEFPTKQQTDVPLGEVTNRIAVVNLDWDNIRAEDLMAVFSSFVPTGGRVLKVSVYPSEFGKERMEKEEIEGPPKEIFASNKRDEENDVEDEEDDDSEESNEEEEEEKIKQAMLKEDKGEEFNSTSLRRYQLERLRYFYAILTFSSKEVAKHVYDAVDGTEYLSSANFFDLRFVPDDTDFSDDTPRDECERIPDGYKPNEFVTDALQHSKVKLTWDADDNARKEAQAKAFKGGKKEIDENDLKAYLGSDSSDDEEEVEVVDNTNGEGSTKKISKKEAERQRMRALLGLSDEPSTKSKEKAPVGEMEITFTSGLSGAPENRESVFENEPEHEETTMEKYIRKERERRKRRKERIKAVKRGETLPESGKESEVKESKDKKEDSESEEDLGFDDPFFNDPEPAKASASARRKEEKRKKREEREAEEAANAAKRAELELLMVDDKNTGVKHFDMNEIEKAEKKARKKGKKGKTGGEPEAPVDDFKMDVNDPRFARLYESHEFAIDPTNPRFKGTSGMKALLEEGRKRRRIRDDDEEAAERGTGKEQNKKQKKESSKDEKDEIKKLVAKVKGKTQKA
ncbi:hypothetical protein VTN00DRAFT_9977 [Thermoascus crustaceus]|uniref:uncharacterized protein n=1 Tax=Thermoascus crustaceus TaxID=5088 RepID=UPI003742F523